MHKKSSPNILKVRMPLFEAGHMPRTLIQMLFSLAALTGLAAGGPAQAGPGHDHGDAPQASTGDGPARAPDSSVFLPKPSQRQLQIRTQIVEAGDAPRSIELMGRVIMDPGAGGKVQAAVAGRIEPGPAGLPAIGARVAAGQVLAYIRPSNGAFERANQAAAGAELRSSLDIAKQRVARLEQLEGSVPQKDIDAARAELRGLTERTRAVDASLNGRETLVAPVSGVIASANAVTGQIVDVRELVFEIIDPARLRVEALAFDATMAQAITGAAAVVGGRKIDLRPLGAGRSLREGALPVQFAVVNGAQVPLALGMPVKVFAATRERIKGLVLPAAAVVRNPANLEIVWVHDAAERFVPTPVRAQAVDGATVVITDGLEPGQRVVVQGAALVNQVR
jgi:hypothetical protein